MHIGEKIKEKVKTQQNVDNAKFAREMGMSAQGLYHIYKKNDINTKLLKKACRILNISIADFFREEFSQNGNADVVHEPQVKYGERKQGRARVSIHIEIEDSKSYHIPVDFRKKIEQLLTETK